MPRPRWRTGIAPVSNALPEGLIALECPVNATGSWLLRDTSAYLPIVAATSPVTLLSRVSTGLSR